jgi:MFS family permease
MGGVPLLARLPPALQRKDYASLWIAVLVLGLGGQMAAVAIGWQVYAIHRDPLDLGLIGLMEFIPLPLLALPAGALADRFSRRLILAVALVMDAAIMSGLVLVSLSGARELWPFLALAFAAGMIVTSEERAVGKECRIGGRSEWSPSH